MNLNFCLLEYCLSLFPCVCVCNKGLCSLIAQHRKHHIGRNKRYFIERVTRDEITDSQLTPTNPDNKQAQYLNAAPSTMVNSHFVKRLSAYLLFAANDDCNTQTLLCGLGRGRVHNLNYKSYALA